MLTALVAIALLTLATTAAAETNDKFDSATAGVSFDQTKPAAQAASINRCNVGADPVNKNRQINPETEALVINAADQKITYGSGNGKDVTCIAYPGVPVVVDKATGKALWVYGCGNPVRSDWFPKPAPLMIAGLAGRDGRDGKDGIDGKDGKDGRDGKNGKDGRDFTPSVATSKSHKVRNFLIAGAVAGGTTAIIMATRDHDSTFAVVSVIATHNWIRY